MSPNRICLRCCDLALAWQPFCDAHRLVGATFEAPLEVTQCDRHEDCECTQAWTVTAELAEDPVEQEWCIGPIAATDAAGHGRTLDKEQTWDAWDALIRVAEKAADVDRAREEPLPFMAGELP